MPTIQTYSGRHYDLLNPQPDQIDLLDIATALAQINRFTGHTRAPYSVAQHSVVVSYLVPKQQALYALLHDAHEAYTGDQASPIAWACAALSKEHLGSEWSPYHELKDRAQATIYNRFGLRRPDEQTLQAIKEADYLALRHETWTWLPGGAADYQDQGPWCEELQIDPMTLIHPRPYQAGGRKAKYNHPGADLLYGVMTPPQARAIFLTRLHFLAEYAMEPDLAECAGDALLAARPAPPVNPYPAMTQASIDAAD